MLSNGQPKPLAAWTAYFSVILIHECAHMLAAQWKGCEVTAIELYPIHGFVRFREPWSRYDDAVIAWGGVAAQAVVALPLVAWVAIFGFTRSDAVNVAIGILGYYSLVVAVFNLIPAPPLDGAKAWYLIPELIKRARSRQTKPKREVVICPQIPRTESYDNSQIERSPFSASSRE